MEKPNIFITGSRTMPWLNTSNTSDIDILIHSQHRLPKIERDQLMQKLLEKYSSRGILDFHFVSGDCESHVFAYCFQYAEELEHNQDLPLPDLIELREYVLDDAYWFVEHSLYKKYYHCLYNIYMYENWYNNQTLELTTDQKEKINELYQHKRGDESWFTEELRADMLTRIEKLLEKVKAES